ncbi:ATR-interacting protein mus304 [Lutzomyia longipalpis]|uniref:ATR-interacting protein mus304 n=1 Tax=Lutzomyia longipalpis TaxID=7200 RepID=UPI00248344A8|nr:ATR-interacting protein mus304 [Lutzomyia longipalpis]
MSKRFSNVIHNKFTNKRAKLDLKITSNVKFNTGSESQSNSSVQIPDSPPKAQPDSTSTNKTDLWDDDPDDFILLASQYAEQVEKIVQPTNVIDLTDITFDRFSREVNASTQVGKNNPAVPDLFGGDDDFFKDLPEDVDRDAPGPSRANNDKVPQKNAENPPKTPKLRTSSGPCGTENNPNTQVDYLMNEIKILRKENEKLKMENSKTFEKYQQKDGEITILRNELEQAQKINRAGSAPSGSNAEAEKIKKTLMRRVEDQNKIIAALENESALKNAFERPMKHTFGTPVDELFAVNLPKLTMLEQEYPTCMAMDMFRYNTRQRAIDHDKRLTKYTIEFQNSLSVVLGSHRDAPGCTEVYRQLQSLALKGICQIQKYSLRLEFTDYTDSKYNPTIEYQHLCDFSKIDSQLEREINLFQVEKLFPSEVCLVGRRFLAIVASACTKLPLIDYLLEEIPVPNDDENFFIDEKLSFLKVLMKIVYDMGYATNIINHVMLIHASTVLFDSLVDQIEENQDHLAFASEFFKIIVFTRPSMNGLLILMRILLKILSKGIASKFLELLCHSSPRDTYNVHDGYKIQQFTEDSCVLQVFCSLLEATCLEVKQSEVQNQWYMDSMMELTLNTVNFFSICFGQHTQWMKDFPARSQCNCYNKIGSCVVVLMHFCLNHWMMRDKVKCKRTSAIAQQGVMLLNNIFSDSSNRNVLKYGGYHVKNRLQKIYNITKYNYKYFDFGPSHKFATETLDMNLIVFDPLCGSDSENTPIDPHDDYLDGVTKNFF